MAIFSRVEKRMIKKLKRERDQRKEMSALYVTCIFVVIIQSTYVACNIVYYTNIVILYITILLYITRDLCKIEYIYNIKTFNNILIKH